MSTISNWLSRLTAVSSLLITSVFIIPSLFIYRQNFLPGGMISGVILLTAVSLFLSYQRVRIQRRVGVRLTLLGLFLWSTGWIIMTVVEPISGWWIFMLGWVGLSGGLFIIGTAEYYQHLPSRWAILPLLLSLWPVLVELAAPYSFAQSMTPLLQLQLMFLFGIGWVMQSFLLAQAKPVPQVAPIPQHSGSSLINR